MNQLSIVICSRNKWISKGLSTNIEQTIGCDFDLKVIDNSSGKYSISEAYNEGIRISKGEIICFLHDDIKFHTQGWGLKIREIFKGNSKVGLLGVAGSKILTKMPSPWWNCPSSQKVIHIKQHLKDGRIEKWNTGFGKGEMEVVAIDGVFMAMRRSKNISFNTSFPGFHFYDLSISLECIRNGFSVLVTNKVEIEHFSLGSLNKEWFESSLQFQREYGMYLPLKSGDALSNRELRNLEVENGILFIRGLLENNLRMETIKYWWKLFLLKPWSFFKFFPRFRKYYRLNPLSYF